MATQPPAQAAGPDSHSGLSHAEAQRRLARDGANELRVSERSSALQALASLLRQPLFVLLFLAAAIYLWLGDRIEALALLASALVAASITVYQKYRTERVLLALRDLSSPRALVLRDGVPQRLPARELVRGDCILLTEGDRVSADARVVEAHDLRVDESLLTGESAPVVKFVGAALFASTLVVSGHGRAVVTAIGAATQFGRIGTTLAQLGQTETPLQRDTARLARAFAVAGAALAVLLALGYGLWYGQWLDGVLRALTLAMAILPEEFPVVITVMLALGAWRMAAAHVLTRRAEAIEALGAATVLCVDKTGTLTCNRMTIVRAALGDGPPRALADDGDPALRDLARVGALASEPQAFDAMDAACRAWAQSLGLPLPANEQLRRRYPMQPQRLVMGLAWATGERTWTIAVKGAPEHVIALCGAAAQRSGPILANARALAADGLRVLAVAQRNGESADLPEQLTQVAFDFVGLIGFEDPLRLEVPQAVRDCRRAGIRVLMITGDFAPTARAIARQAGLAEQPLVVDGAALEHELDQSSTSSDLRQRLRVIHAVARATPMLKLKLVQTLQAAGDIVAMTGDGVNDAPALRAAHIGVAMGQRGSDVAREAAGLVLLRDDFQSLVGAVSQGRRVFANLRQALTYVLAVHVPLVGISVVPLLVGAPPMLLPLHVMFMEFVIDPVCSLAFEAETARHDAMSRPPRALGERVLEMSHIIAALLQGLVALAVVAGVFGYGMALGHAEPELRGGVFSALVLTNVALAILDRHASATLRERLTAPNRVLWIAVGVTLAAWAAVLGVPALRDLFRLSPPAPALAATLVGSLLLAVVMLEGLRRVRK